MRTWTLEVTISVADSWVADGFEATPEHIADTLTEGILGWARSDEKEVTARTISAPSPAQIAGLQSGEIVASD